MSFSVVSCIDRQIIKWNGTHRYIQVYAVLKYLIIQPFAGKESVQIVLCDFHSTALEGGNWKGPHLGGLELLKFSLHQRHPRSTNVNHNAILKAFHLRFHCQTSLNPPQMHLSHCSTRDSTSFRVVSKPACLNLINLNSCCFTYTKPRTILALCSGFMLASQPKYKARFMYG